MFILAAALGFGEINSFNLVWPSLNQNVLKDIYLDHLNLPRCVQLLVQLLVLVVYSLQPAIIVNSFFLSRTCCGLNVVFVIISPSPPLFVLTA